MHRYHYGRFKFLNYSVPPVFFIVNLSIVFNHLQIGSYCYFIFKCNLFYKRIKLTKKYFSGNTVFLQAVQYGRLQLVHMLINAQCRVTIFNQSQHTALHIAAENNRFEVLEILMEKDINPRKTDHTGKTAISLAAQTGSYEALKILSVVKSTLNVCDLYGMTPLHWSVAGNYLKCIQVNCTLIHQYNGTVYLYSWRYYFVIFSSKGYLCQGSMVPSLTL